MCATALVALFGRADERRAAADADGQTPREPARAAPRAGTMDDAQLRAAVDAVLAASEHADWSRWRAAVERAAAPAARRRGSGAGA